MKKLFFTFSIACCLQFGFSQGDAVRPVPYVSLHALEEVQDQVVLDSLALWEEKVYLHMDRTSAEPGEALFFKAYVFNVPTRNRLSPSGVLKLELRDAENILVSSQYHPLSGGAGEGVLRLPKRLEEGTYELVAYTRWMQNYGKDQFFRREIQVGEVSDPDKEALSSSEGQITFYPEGGRLLAGIQNRLVVRAAEPDADWPEGHIIDGSGRSLVPVQEYGSGFGMAIFRPEAGIQYRLRTLKGTELELPEVAASGYSLKVNSLEADRLRLEVQPTGAMSAEPVVLKGERNGKTYFIHVLEFEEMPTATLDIPKAGLPLGIMKFTLTGLDEHLWTERPVWIDAPGALHIEVEPLQVNYSEGGENAFRVRVTGPDGSPVQTDLSLAVTEGGRADSAALLSYLDPMASGASYREARQNRFLQDLMIQTEVSEREDKTLPGEIRYPVQRALELHGTAYDLDNNLLANTEIQMLATSDSTLVIREAKTDTAGVLHLEGLEVIGETQFVFRTKGDEQTQRLVKIKPIRERADKNNTSTPEPSKSKTYQKSRRNNQLVETTPTVAFDTTGVIQLDEATLQKQREQRKVVPSLYGIEPNPFDIVYQDLENPMPIDILIRKIPGIQSRPTVDGVPVAYHTRRGGGGVLWVVDGQIIRTGGDPYLSPLVYLTPLDILRIEFIIDAGQASIFGVQAPTGVMLVYTRSGNYLDYVNRKEGGLKFKGYEPSLDHATWLVERNESRKLRRKDPSTLYWDPAVRTDKKGEATIRFQSPGDYSGVRLSVETLTKEGYLGSFQGEY